LVSPTSFDITTRPGGTVEVLVSPRGERSVRLVGFASKASARAWAIDRRNREAVAGELSFAAPVAPKGAIGC
jgi:hypothetical protein